MFVHKSYDEVYEKNFPRFGFNLLPVDRQFKPWVEYHELTKF